MSASRPGSLMLRAATAASGGTGAPFATYCSIWAWTVLIRAWTSRPVGRRVLDLLDRGAQVRLRLAEAAQVEA